MGLNNGKRFWDICTFVIETTLFRDSGVNELGVRVWGGVLGLVTVYVQTLLAELRNSPP